MRSSESIWATHPAALFSTNLQELPPTTRYRTCSKAPSAQELKFHFRSPLGVCPSIWADRVMGAVGSDTRRRARSRCHLTSSVRNKVDGLLVAPALSSFQAGQQKTAHNPKGTGGLWPNSLARPARSSQIAQQIKDCCSAEPRQNPGLNEIRGGAVLCSLEFQSGSGRV